MNIVNRKAICLLSSFGWRGQASVLSPSINIFWFAFNCKVRLIWARDLTRFLLRKCSLFKQRPYPLLRESCKSHINQNGKYKRTLELWSRPKRLREIPKTYFIILVTMDSEGTWWKLYSCRDDIKSHPKMSSESESSFCRQFQWQRT